MWQEILSIMLQHIPKKKENQPEDALANMVDLCLLKWS